MSPSSVILQLLIFLKVNFIILYEIEIVNKWTTCNFHLLCLNINSIGTRVVIMTIRTLPSVEFEPQHFGNRIQFLTGVVTKGVSLHRFLSHNILKEVPCFAQILKLGIWRILCLCMKLRRGMNAFHLEKLFLTSTLFGISSLNITVIAHTDAYSTEQGHRLFWKFFRRLDRTIAFLLKVNWYAVFFFYNWWYKPNSNK